MGTPFVRQKYHSTVAHEMAWPHTVASALPSWLPFGGQSLSAGTYNAIARPLGVVYCAIIAVCPLLSWVKTDPKTFWKKARIPVLCAVVLFVGLMSYFVTTLYPAYDAIIQAGGTEAEELASEGPVWYYNGIAVVGFASKSGYGDNTELLSIAASYGKTVAQVILRWGLQRGFICIPKSVHRERIESNAQVFDFELSAADMDRIFALNKNARVGSDPETFPF